MNKRIVAYCFMSVMSLALILTSCPSPSSGGSSDDGGTSGGLIDFGHNDGASIEVTLDFSGVAEKSRVGLVAIGAYEMAASSSDTATDVDVAYISEISGDSLSFSITGARAGFWYICGIHLYDVIGSETMDLSSCSTVSVQASVGSSVATTVYAYSDYDGRYLGANPATLAGDIDVSCLDQSLLDTCVVNLSADDGDENTDDPDLYYNIALDGSDSVSYRFINLDPDNVYSWSIDAYCSDWNGSILAYDESYFGGDDSVLISSGDNAKNLITLQRFDTNGGYDGSNGEAGIQGTLDISNLASDTYCIRIGCEAEGFSYRLGYEFMNFESGDTLIYTFTSLNPLIGHTLTFEISTEYSAEYPWDSLPEITVPASNLSDGSTTTVNFTLPAP